MEKLSIEELEQRKGKPLYSVELKCYFILDELWYDDETRELNCLEGTDGVDYPYRENEYGFYDFNPNDNRVYDYGTLVDWYISSVDKDDTPVWTEEHIKELMNDFYIVVKSIKV